MQKDGSKLRGAIKKGRHAYETFSKWHKAGDKTARARIKQRTEALEKYNAAAQRRKQSGIRDA